MPELFDELRAARQLAVAIGETNHLLDGPVHGELAAAALRRIGIYDAA